jgi:hypothetical protein
MRLPSRLPSLLSGLLQLLPASLPAQPSPSIPGIAVAWSSPSSGKYIGSPGLAKLPDGSLVASHDEFGGGSTQNTSGVTRIHRSTDGGLTWAPAAVVNGAFWSNLFVHQGQLYLLGTTHQYGNAVIRRSEDGGYSWTAPTNPASGLLASNGQYHCAPMPVIKHNGRLWRAMERRDPASGWAPNFRACMMSVPADADLLDASQWTFSNFLPGQGAWLDSKFGGWLEGNAVVDPSGNLVNLLRVDHPVFPEKSALVRVSSDGRSITFNPAADFVEMPGGAKKFAIRHDPVSGRYWSLANLVPPEFQAGRHPASSRNTLNLVSSENLRDWSDHGVVLQHPDATKHGFQYIEWLFDGNDIIAASRTAFDDHAGGAANYHDANCLTFHRFTGFRDFNGGLLPGTWKQVFFGRADILPGADADSDGFTNRHEFLAGSNPRRAGSTPALARATARVAIAGAAGVDEYRVTAAGTWTYLRKLSAVSYQSIIHHQGWLYGSGFSRIDRIDPATGTATTLATRNAGSAATAGWTNADSQQLAVGPDGRLYFSTAFGASAGEGIFRLNADGSGFERFIARSGGTAPGAWDLNNARGLTWHDGRLFVSSRAGFSSTSRPVYEFSGTGGLQRTLRSDLRAPQGLVSDGGEILVAGVAGSLTGLDAVSGSVSQLVSGLPDMACMTAVEILGEIHVLTYQHGVWRHRDSSSLTRAFVPPNSNNASMVVIPEPDPYAAWAATQPGLVETAAGDDPDRDGVPNRLEFLLGWDPTDGSSRFAIRFGENQGSAGMDLRWPSAPGLVFTVRSSGDLHDWSTIEAVIFGETGEDEATFQTLPSVEGQRFYRVEWTH